MLNNLSKERLLFEILESQNTINKIESKIPLKFNILDLFKLIKLIKEIIEIIKIYKNDYRIREKNF